MWLATEALIFGLFANGLNLLLGYGGLISFGHAAYFGIGGYACTLLLKKAGLSMGLGIILCPSYCSFRRAYNRVVLCSTYQSLFCDAHHGICPIDLGYCF